MANEALSRIELTATTSGVSEAAAEVRKLDDAQKGVINSSQEIEKKTLSVERSLNRLQRQYDLAWRSQQKFAQAQESLGQALSQGLIDHQRYAQLLELVRRQTTLLPGANDNAAKSIGAVGAQMQNLRAQAFDVAQTIATSSPLTVLMQQGPQVFQALDGPGGVKQGIKNVGNSLAAMIKPAYVGGAALVAAAVGAIAAWSRFDDQQKAIQGTLAGLGARVGLTAAQFTQMAQATAGANNLSVRQTTELGLAYARTGKLGSENIERLIGVTKNYAATTGLSIEDAKTELASLFSDPAAAIDKLQKQFALLDGTTRDQVESLLRQGRAQEAIQIALDKLPGSLANYNTSLGKISSAWEYLKGKISDADHAVGDFLNRFLGTSSTEDRIKALTTRIETLKKVADLPAQPGAPPGQKVGMSVDAPTVASTTSSTPLSGRLSAANELSDATRKLTQDQIALRRSMENEADKQLTQSLVDRADAVRDIAKELGNATPEQKKYLDWEKALRDATNSTDPEFKRQIGNIDDVNVALEKVVQRNKTYLTSEERAAAAREIETDALHAHTEAERASIAQRKAQLDVSGQLIKGSEAEAAGQHAYNMVLDEGQEKLRLQIRDQKMAADVVELETKMIGASAVERDKALAGLEAEQKLTRDGVNLSDALAKSYIEQAKANAVRRAEMEKARIVHDIQQERATVFLSPEETQITQRLKPIYGDDYKAALKSAEADQIRTTDTIKTGWNDAKRAVTDFATSFATDMAHGVKASEALLNALKKVGDSLITGGISKGIEGLSTGNWAAAGLGAAETGIGLLLNAFGPSEKSKQRKQQMMDAWAKQQQDDFDAIQKQQQAVIDAGIASAKASEEAAKEATRVAEEAARAAEELARRIEGFQDRTALAGLDTTTISGQLAAFDIQAQRQREEEVRAGGEALVELEEALYAERERIVRDYVDQAIVEEKRRYEEARQFLDQFARTIKQFVDNLKAGAQSPLSPADRLAQAQAQYNAQLALAQGGNRDALTGITSYASNLLDAAKAFYASTSQFQNIFANVTNQLTALPGQVTPEQLIVDAIGSQTKSLSDILNELDTNGDGMISRQEAANTFLDSIFNELDTNGDGQLDKLELIRGFTQGTNDDTSSIGLNTTTANDINTTNQSILNTISLHTDQLATIQQQLQNVFNTTAKTSNNAARVANNTMYSANQDTQSSVGIAGDFTYARGGWVYGTGTGLSDSIAARLSNGEFVVRASQAREYAPQLEAINSGRGMNDNDALVGEVRSLRAELTQLRSDVQQGTRATVAGAQYVREGVDQTTSAQSEVARDAKLESVKRRAA